MAVMKKTIKKAVKDRKSYREVEAKMLRQAKQAVK